MRAAGVKALFFDVFGTLVDWRSGVAGAAHAAEDRAAVSAASLLDLADQVGD